jgi:cytochrome c oxidase cbb3-type subunit 3
MKESSCESFDGIKENRENPPPAYFTYLLFGLILWGVIYAAYFLLSGWTSNGEFKEEMREHQAKYQVVTPEAAQKK